MKNIPKLNAAYWFLMFLCTTMGELFGNLISRNFELGYTGGALIDICVFAAAITFVFILKLKSDLAYWALILIGNIGGTNLADWVTLEPLANDRTWGLLKPLQLGTKLGSVAVITSLLLILVVRYWIVRKDQEETVGAKVFYWIAILLSSTFGTTSGDLITNDTPLGAFWGSVFLLGLLSVVFMAYKRGRLGFAPAYWLALVLMHPVGATVGNYVSKPIGLNLGNVYTNLAMALMFGAIYFRNSLSGENSAGREELRG
jgi:uncharacterized membrane-anchored protein